MTKSHPGKQKLWLPLEMEKRGKPKADLVLKQIKSYGSPTTLNKWIHLFWKEQRQFDWSQMRKKPKRWLYSLLLVVMAAPRMEAPMRNPRAPLGYNAEISLNPREAKEMEPIGHARWWLQIFCFGRLVNGTNYWSRERKKEEDMVTLLWAWLVNL